MNVDNILGFGVLLVFLVMLGCAGQWDYEEAKRGEITAPKMCR